MSGFTRDGITLSVSRTRRIWAAAWRPALFAVLMWLAAAAGQIPVPGTPTPITLQTLVVMMAGLMLTPAQATSAISAYLLIGAAGAPVFAGGMSTAALVGPNAGFLVGFLPGVVVTSLLAGRRGGRGGSDLMEARLGGRFHAERGNVAARPALPFMRGTAMRLALRFARNIVAALVGCVGVVYALGIAYQAALTHAPFTVVALASASFLIGDLIKATIAATLATTLLRR